MGQYIRSLDLHVADDEPIGGLFTSGYARAETPTSGQCITYMEASPVSRSKGVKSADLFEESKQMSANGCQHSH